MSTLQDKKLGWAEGPGCADHASIDRIAAYYAPNANAPFPQPFWELLSSLAVVFIPVAIVVWDHQTATKAELEVQAPGQAGT